MVVGRRQITLQTGFSLVELLVSVAIIGVLATAGTVGYLGYIESSKDEASIADAEAVNRIVETDSQSIDMGSSSTSTLNNSITTESTCRDQADKIVFELNTTQNKTSHHDDSCPFAFNGNRAWNNLHHNDTANSVDYFAACTVTTNGGTIEVPRGRMMVGCTDPLATISSADYKLFTCLCSGNDSCTTTDVETDCTTNLNHGYADLETCKANWSDVAANDEKCPSPGAFN
jgi:prepilin-type N-terminal cleavage/methylation domain-containing protein